MLRISNLSLRRGPKLLLEDVNLQIHPGQKVGVTGANGSGKSSLFSLILRQFGPDAGDVHVPADWVIGHVAQETPADTRACIEYVLDGDAELRQVERRLAAAGKSGEGEELARLHGLYEQLGGYAARSRAGRLLHGLGFTAADETRAVEEFSGGWRARLNLARALMCRSSLLLLDEPTNHLDLDAVIWLEQWLRAYPGTLLLVSHDRDFLDAVAGHILHLENRQATIWAGNYSAFERQRAERLAQQQAQYEKQQREIAHMRAFVDRFRAKASKARQAQSRLKALERMEVILPAHVDSPFRFSLIKPDKTPNPLLRLENAAAGYGATRVLEQVNLTLGPGDRVGLLGRNGAGKSTLIRLMSGAMDVFEGERVAARDLCVGYFAQHQLEQLDSQASPLEHLLAIEPEAKEAGLRTFLGGFGFSGDSALAPTAPFSGGEKSRLALALLVYRRPNLLLLDEPTNHLDLEMRQALAYALQEFTGAMVIVSHDRHLLRVATDELLLVDGGRVMRFGGSLDDYPAWLAGRYREDDAPAQAASIGSARAQRKHRRRQEAERRQAAAPLVRQIERAEAELARLQRRRAEIAGRLGDSSLYDDDNRDTLRRVLDEQADIDWAMARAEAGWLEASEALERLEESAEPRRRRKLT